MGRYWSSRRAGNAVPIAPPPPNPIEDVAISVFSLSPITVNWSQDPEDNVTVTVRVYRYDAGDLVLLEEATDTVCEAQTRESGVTAVALLQYVGSVQYPGQTEVFSAVTPP